MEILAPMKKYLFSLLIILFCFVSATAQHIQRTRNTEARKALKILKNDLRLLKTEDASNFCLYISKGTIPDNHPNAIFYERVNSNRRFLQQQLKETTKRYNHKIKSIIKKLKC
jgi:hypothetical protein